MTPKTIFAYFSLLICFNVKAQTEPATDSVNSDRVTFERVEVEANFHGGIPAWKKFLEQKLNPNVPVDNGAPIGKYMVFVQFVVDKEGNIKDVKALTNHGFGMEQEVIRLIRTGPKWEPATQNGRKVNAYRKQPVTFVVEDESINVSSKDGYVLYTGTDNTVTITIKKVKAENLKLTISQGSIVSNGEDSYTVKVDKIGKAVIRIYNTKKGNKEIGAVSFEVKSP